MAHRYLHEDGVLRLIDLRSAALREYPEFGQVPWPAPWYRNQLVLLVMALGCWLSCFIVALVTMSPWVLGGCLAFWVACIAAWATLVA